LKAVFCQTGTGVSSPTSVFASLAEASITLLIGWCAWRLFETGLAVKLSREEGGVQSARTVQPLLRAVGRLVIAQSR
jgi:hypothetical protein